MVRIRVRTKLIVAILLTMLIPLFIAGYMSYTESKNALQSQQESQLRLMTENVAASIGTTIDRNKDFMKFYSETSRIQTLADKISQGVKAEKDLDTVKKMLHKMYTDGKGNFENVFVIDKAGKVIADGTDGSTVGTNLSERDYFQRAINGEINYSDILKSKFTGNPVVVIAAPVSDSKKQLTLVLAVTTKFSLLSKNATELKAGQTGYAYMVDKDGLIIYHPKKEKILKENLAQSKIPELVSAVNKMRSGQKGYSFYTYEGVYKFIAYAPTGKWAVAVTIPVTEYMTAANNILKHTLWIMLFFILLGTAVAYFIAQQFCKPLQQLGEGAKALANGDLTRLVIVKVQDEVGDLAQAFNNMSSDLRNLVIQIIEAANTLAATSEELSASSEETTAATEEVTNSITQLATGATSQSKSVEETSAVIQQMSAAIQQVSASAENVSQNSIKASEAAKQGLIQAENAVSKIKQVSEISNQTADAINVLGEQSTEIGQIVDVIKGIADQTNLLALNAAIEAARAGEQGRGFAVVAEEVRKLAEQSSTSAEKIAGLIGNIQAETQRLVDIMGNGSIHVTEGVDAVDATGSVFKTIVTEIDHVVEQILQVSAASQEMAHGSNQAVSAVTNIASIAEQTAAGTQEVLAAAEEQSASMESIASSSEELAQLGEKLQHLVARFTV